MEELDMEKIIKTNYKIINLVEELNHCIRSWYYRFFPSNIRQGEFKGCCNEDEIKIIRECFYIFKNNNPDIDEDTALRAIIGYYYSIQVIEYRVLLNEYDANYFKIVETDKNYEFFQDNKGNDYSWVVDVRKDSPMFSKVDMQITPVLEKKSWNPTMYYINTRNPLPWPIYKRANDYDNELEKLTTQKKHFGCLKEFYTTQDARKIVEELTTSNDIEWVSSIRKKILNMNPEPFIGGKKKRKRSLKKRRNMKQINKKTNKKTNKKK